MGISAGVREQDMVLTEFILFALGQTCTRLSPKKETNPVCAFDANESVFFFFVCVVFLKSFTFLQLKLHDFSSQISSFLNPVISVKKKNAAWI